MKKIALLIMFLLCATPVWAGERLLVRFHDPTIQHGLVGYGLIVVQEQRGRRGMAIYELAGAEAPSAQQRDALLEQIRNLPEVEWAEWDQPVHGPQSWPDDPLLDQQAHWQQALNLPAAWQYSTDCRGVVVAVIDSGLDVEHPDLAANVWVNSAEVPDTGKDDDNNGYRDDYRGWNAINDSGDVGDGLGHGTHVAGLIGAAGNNGLGGAGVCWQANLLPLKFLNANGYGRMSDAVLATYYVLDLQERFPDYRYIINNAWAGPHSHAFNQAVADATAAGMLVVNAAGNQGRDIDDLPAYPASLARDDFAVVAVTSVDTRDDGPPTTDSGGNLGLYSVTLAAPGLGILSTAPGGNHVMDSGTSMATALVSGVAALLWQQNPELSAPGVRALLEAYNTPMPELLGRIKAPGVPDAATLLLQAGDSPPLLGELRVAADETLIRGVNLAAVEWLMLDRVYPVAVQPMGNDELLVVNPDELTCGYLNVGTAPLGQPGLYIDVDPSAPDVLELVPTSDDEWRLAWQAGPRVTEVVVQHDDGGGFFHEHIRANPAATPLTISGLSVAGRLRLQAVSACRDRDGESLVARQSGFSESVTVQELPPPEPTEPSIPFEPPLIDDEDTEPMPEPEPAPEPDDSTVAPGDSETPSETEPVSQPPVPAPGGGGAIGPLLLLLLFGGWSWKNQRPEGDSRHLKIKISQCLSREIVRV